MSKPYFAFITFTHNSKRIDGGSIFDAELVGFTDIDLEFLRSQGKIMFVAPKSSAPIVVPEVKVVESEIIPVEEVQQPEPMIESAPVVVEELAAEPTELPVIEEPLIETESPAVEEEVVGEVVLQSDDRIDVEINESDLRLMKKADLILLAEKYNIENPSKMTKENLILKISELNS